MTYREKLQKEHPESVGTKFVGGCEGCPKEYWPELTRYIFGNCPPGLEFKCARCWDSEAP